MPAGFAFPPPPPPPPRPPDTTPPAPSYRAGYLQRGRGNGPYQGRGRGGNGRGPGFQNFRGGSRGNPAKWQPQQSSDRGIYGNYSDGPQGRKRGESFAPSRPPPENQRQNLKRSWADASGSPKQHVAKGQAAPAVPSFGFELPGLSNSTKSTPQPLPAQGSEALPTSKRRKDREQNRLGLTPRMEEHEASEDEEDDIDEEQRLAAALREDIGKSGLRSEHEGKFTIPTTPSEIAAWIAERKKNFYNKAKMAAASARKEAEKEQRASSKKGRAARESKRGAKASAEPTGRQSGRGSQHMETMEHAKVDCQEQATANMSNVDCIQEKTDELRRQLVALEGQLLKSKSQRAIVDSKDRSMSFTKLDKIKIIENENMHHDGLIAIPKDINIEGDGEVLATSESGESLTKEALERLVAKERADGVLEDGQENYVADKSSDLRNRSVDEDRDDGTSSSGTSDMSSLGEGGPEEKSSKIAADNEEPTKAPKKDLGKRVCHAFASRGSCRYGEGCRYSHDVAGNSRRAKNHNEVQTTASGRMSLYERLMKRQQEEENEELLRYIMAFGARGYFDRRSSG